jgi:PhzF family phenazine biosynthesis protein
MTRIRIFQVDAFAERPFTGNPAAVCLLDNEKDANWMQAVAAEMNLSETAFVRPSDAGFELRWFTPKVEVDLCGHATLAAAHVLWSEEVVATDAVIQFQTRCGALTCTRNEGRIELDFPATPAEAAAPPIGLVEALGIEPKFVGKTRFDYIVLLDSEQSLRSVAPDFQRLGAVKTRGVIVTAAASDARDRVDFVSRFFAPAVGIDEDPVCGSAHCCLGPFWAQRLGKNELSGYQASARGGHVRVRVAGDRVILGGQAVTVLRGELM